MPRIYNATFQPFTYDELATPIREMTHAQQKIEEDYDNNMLVVDSLRQRAQSELDINPDSKWANGVMNYANQLEGYATDLARNGLTRETRNNLLNMKRGYGTTISPVLMAMQREKELQSIRDKSAGTRTVFGTMPTIDEIIANPNVGQSMYSGEDVYKVAKEQAEAASKRNIQLFKPSNYNAYLYEYGKKKGFTNDEINYMLQNDPEFANMFGYIRQQFGYPNDGTLTQEQQNKLNNEIVAGALAGFTGDVDMNYAQRPDYHDPMYWLNYETKKREFNGNNGGYVGNGGTNSNGPTLLFGQTVDPKKQKQNDVFRNGIINDKNIVTGIEHTVDGDVYQISDDYVNKILDGLNGKSSVGNWTFGNASPFGGPTTDQKSDDIARQKKYASIYGITKNDTPQTAKNKIQKYLSRKADANDLSDATLHTNLQVWTDPSDWDVIRARHDGTNGNQNILMQDESGHWISSGKKMNPKDYNPVRSEIGLGGIYQIWTKKDGKADDDDYTVITPFWNKQYGDQIYKNYMSESGPVGLNKAYNSRNKFNANVIRNTLDYNMKSFDPEVLEKSTGYKKGDIKKIVNSTSDYSGDNRNLVNFINNIEYKYYTYEANMYAQMLQEDPQNQDLAKKYEVAYNRLQNVVKEINLMNNIIKSQDDALVGIQDNIMQVLATTKKTQPEQYGGGDYRK